MPLSPPNPSPPSSTHLNSNQQLHSTIIHHIPQPSAPEQSILNVIELVIYISLILLCCVKLGVITYTIPHVISGISSINLYTKYIVRSALDWSSAIALSELALAASLSNTSITLLSILSIIVFLPTFLVASALSPRNTSLVKLCGNINPQPILLAQPLSVPTVGLLLWQLLLLSLLAVLDPTQAYLHTPIDPALLSPLHADPPTFSSLSSLHAAVFSFGLIPQTFSFFLRLITLISLLISLFLSNCMLYWLLFGVDSIFSPSQTHQAVTKQYQDQQRRNNQSNSNSNSINSTDCCGENQLSSPLLEFSDDLSQIAQHKSPQKSQSQREHTPHFQQQPQQSTPLPLSQLSLNTSTPVESISSNPHPNSNSERTFEDHLPLNHNATNPLKPSIILFLIPTTMTIAFIITISTAALLDPYYLHQAGLSRTTQPSGFSQIPIFWSGLYSRPPLHLPTTTTLSLPCVFTALSHILTYFAVFYLFFSFFFPYYLFDPTIRNYRGLPSAMTTNLTQRSDFPDFILHPATSPSSSTLPSASCTSTDSLSTPTPPSLAHLNPNPTQPIPTLLSPIILEETPDDPALTDRTAINAQQSTISSTSPFDSPIPPDPIDIQKQLQNDFQSEEPEAPLYHCSTRNCREHPGHHTHSSRFSTISLSFSPSEAILMSHLVAVTVCLAFGDQIYALLMQSSAFLYEHFLNRNILAEFQLPLTSTIWHYSNIKSIPTATILLSLLNDIPTDSISPKSPLLTSPLSEDNLSTLLEALTPNYNTFLDIFNQHAQHEFHIISRPFLISTLFSPLTTTNSYLISAYLISFGCIFIIFKYALRLTMMINTPASLYTTRPILIPVTTIKLAPTSPRSSTSRSVSKQNDSSRAPLHTANPSQLTTSRSTTGTKSSKADKPQNDWDSSLNKPKSPRRFISTTTSRPTTTSSIELAPKRTFGELLGVFVPFLAILTIFLPLLSLFHPELFPSLLTFFSQPQRQDFNAQPPAFPIFPFVIRRVLNPLKKLLYAITQSTNPTLFSIQLDDTGLEFRDITLQRLVTYAAKKTVQMADFFNMYPHSFVLLYCCVISLMGVCIAILLIPYTQSGQEREEVQKESKRSGKETRSTPKSSSPETASRLPRTAQRCRIPLIVLRKYYHIVLFIIALVPALVDMSCLSLSFTCCLMLLLTIELFRCFQIDIYIPFIDITIPVGSSLYRFFQSFSDSRDAGPIIVTQIYLLLGCAIPLWTISILSFSVYHHQQFLIQFQQSYNSSPMPYAFTTPNPILPPLAERIFDSTNDHYYLPLYGPTQTFFPTISETTSSDGPNQAHNLPEFSMDEVLEADLKIETSFGSTQPTPPTPALTPTSSLPQPLPFLTIPIHTQHSNTQQVLTTHLSYDFVSALSTDLQLFLYNLTRSTWTPFPVHAHTLEFAPVLDKFERSQHPGAAQSPIIDPTDEDIPTPLRPPFLQQNYPTSDLITYNRLWLITLSGIVALGIGDTFATFFGISLSALSPRCRAMKWPQSNKTVIGTFGFASSMFLTLLLCGHSYQQYTSYYLSRGSALDPNMLFFLPALPPTIDDLLPNVIAVTIVALVEATTTQIDNLVLPIICVVTFALFTNSLLPL